MERKGKKTRLTDHGRPRFLVHQQSFDLLYRVVLLSGHHLPSKMRWRTGIRGVDGGNYSSRNEGVVVVVHNPGPKPVRMLLLSPKRTLEV